MQNPFSTVKTRFIGLFFGVIACYSALSIADNIVVPDPPQLAAKSWIMVDYDSGRVLAESNSTMRVEPASLTKIMSSYIVSRELANKRLAMNDMVTISQEAWRQEGSRSFINVGAQIPVEVLVHGMIIQSGNDATVALAEKVAGSSEIFSQLMNEHAKRLGASNTNFVNPSGLPHPEHYTTAEDMAKIAIAEIREYPEIYKIYAKKEYTWNGIKQHNRNRLLWQDESVDGMKTGHTNSAGYCLVASAKRGDMRLVTVILGADSEKARIQETQKLLNYGFRFYETHQLYQANQSLQQVHVWQGEVDEVSIGTQQALHLTVPRGQYEKLKPVIEFRPDLVAPIQKGQTIGTLKVTLADKELANLPLVAMNDVAEGGFFKRVIDQAKLAIIRLTK
jgi:serine-type D-Ala-D-Ala carboxypeptidase (penicillin-binding protein 5/6)